MATTQKVVKARPSQELAEMDALDIALINWKEGDLIDPELLRPNLDHIRTEDGNAVDNLFSEKQMRLLTEPLFSSWPGPGDSRPFVVMANVGVYYGLWLPPIVPDTLLTLDVKFPTDLKPKHNRSYFTWEYGKPPDVVVEIVSNDEGGELDRKREIYAKVGALYYIVYDPQRYLKGKKLTILELGRRAFRQRTERYFPDIGLGVQMWQGVHEGIRETWLRWCYEDGTLIPTGAERAEQERERAEQEYGRAEQERERAEQEYSRAERLATKLRELGIDPDMLS